MNLIKDLTARIEDYRKTNKVPCKNFKTERAAEKATADMARIVGRHFDKFNSVDAKPAQYVVFYIEAWGRWVGCINLTEVMRRPTSSGGYIGIAKGFYCF